MTTNSPILYQINTRVWLNHFRSRHHHRPTLKDVPHRYWKTLRAKGIDYVWLMGVWEVPASAISEYCFVDGLREAYAEALPDWHVDDVIGSPYAVAHYRLSPMLGTEADLARVREELHGLGMKLILDFVPNHFSAHSPLIGRHPEAFLQGTFDDLNRDQATFFVAPGVRDRVFAHGRDPYFLPWTDTVQVNYSVEAGQAFMRQQLLDVAAHCDGVRCDMAMLVLRDVFPSTWQSHVPLPEMPQEEFWKGAIEGVHRKHPEFIFIAESYWDLEARLHDLGFHYTYDKGLLDHLIEGDLGAVVHRVQRDRPHVSQGVHFLENHDEKRAMHVFGEQQSFAAAAAIYTLPGIRFFYDGQWEGRQVRIPVQLGREPHEELNIRARDFYDRLLTVIRDDVYRKGEFAVIDTAPAYEGDEGHHRILVWERRVGREVRLAVINFSSHPSSCRIPWRWHCRDQVQLMDQLNSLQFDYSKEKLAGEGLYILLKPFDAHLFSFTTL